MPVGGSAQSSLKSSRFASRFAQYKKRPYLQEACQWWFAPLAFRYPLIGRLERLAVCDDVARWNPREEGPARPQTVHRAALDHRSFAHHVRSVATDGAVGGDEPR
jgi:hypothetical protein